MHVLTRKPGSIGTDGSASGRRLDRYIEPPGGSYQAAIERDQSCIEASGYREVQGIRRTQRQLEAPGKNIGEPGIGRPNFYRRDQRRTPSVKVRQAREGIGRRQSSHTDKA